MKNLKVFISNFERKILRISSKEISNIEKIALRRHEPERINHSLEVVARGIEFREKTNKTLIKTKKN